MVRTFDEWLVSKGVVSGDPELDRLIHEFLFGAADGDTSWWGPSCGWMSAAATTFFQGKGLAARSESTPDPSQDPRALDAIGYGDRLLDPDNGPHAYTVVEMPSGDYLLDFTAGQYGYREFPMVARLDERGQWQRVAGLAAPRPETAPSLEL